MRVNVVTCGTSLLTNGTSADERKMIFALANKQEKEYSREELEKLDLILERRREELLSADEGLARKLSAELNGLIGYYRDHDGLDEAKKDVTYLICTDTYQGKKAASLLEDWARTRDMNVNVCPIKDLNTASMALFQLGMNNLVEWCADTLPEFRKRGYRVIFNLVGGFKALQGYMQTLGMFYADEIIYIFESSGEILSIPHLPVDLAENSKRVMEENLPLLRQLNDHNLKFSECGALPASMLQIIGDNCALSPWGTLMFRRFKDEFYGAKLLPPWVRNVAYGKGLEAEVAKLDRLMIVWVNTAIDKLCSYYAGGAAKNLTSLSLRALAGTPCPPSTHEFNLWSTQNAWRAFCHYEEGEKGKTLVIDSIGVGLTH